MIKPRWDMGDWVFSPDPLGFYTLSICAKDGGICASCKPRMHAFQGLLTARQLGNGRDNGQAKIVDIDIENAIFLPKTFKIEE